MKSLALVAFGVTLSLPAHAETPARPAAEEPVDREAVLLRLLEDAASRAEDEERARELDAKAAERRADLEAKQAELLEAYFAPAEELGVPEETGTLRPPSAALRETR